MSRTVKIGAYLAGVAVLVAYFAWATAAGGEGVEGVVVREGAASLEASDQPGPTDTIVIERVVAPIDSWVVVHLDDDGMPGMRVGLAQVPAGTSRDVEVGIASEEPLTPRLLVALHADRGARGEFDFDMDDMAHSPDKPYFVNGEEVALAVTVEESDSDAVTGEADYSPGMP
ncbi:MAG: hypothetical protein IBX62_05620 [Coriobacteriia bacterium]|nr:hypothetical protein [Coriobacteriia bacterium]